MIRRRDERVSMGVLGHSSKDSSLGRGTTSRLGPPPRSSTGKLAARVAGERSRVTTIRRRDMSVKRCSARAPTESVASEAILRWLKKQAEHTLLQPREGSLQTDPGVPAIVYTRACLNTLHDARVSERGIDRR